MEELNQLNSHENNDTDIILEEYESNEELIFIKLKYRGGIWVK